MAKILIFVVMAGVCFGQSGSVSGLVTDPSGAPVEGAGVRAVRVETQAVARTVTNGSGLYAFPALAPGQYVLTVEKEGFRTAERRELVVNVAGWLSENFALVIGERADSLTVEDRAPVIERLSPAVQTMFDREMVQNLPLNGRSFQSLIELAPGVVLTPTSFASPGQFSVNGQRANANYFMIDGVSANVGVSASATAFPQSSGSLPGQTMMGGTNGLVSIDALQEFRVLTSSFAPEFGRMPGGQVLIQTRSGSNRYTGSLYNYFRNEKLDANDWLANSEGVARRALRQNLFGGVLGGPVWAPGLYQGRDRTFFFVSYEGQRLTQPQATLVNALVPSTAARQMAQGAQATVLNAFPVPNRPAVAGDPAMMERFVAGVSFPSGFDAFSTRLDHRFSDNSNIFYRFNRSPSWQRNFAFANGENFQQMHATTHTGGWAWTISPALVSDLRLNWSESEGEFDFRARAVGGALLPPDDFYFPAGLDRTRASVNWNLISGPAGTTSITQGRSLGNRQRQFNLVENFTWVAGRHQFRFGYDYRLLRPSQGLRQSGISMVFGGVEPFLRTGNVNLSIQTFTPEGRFLVPNHSWYAQDTWKIHPRFTLTYGLRYEVNPAPYGDSLPSTFTGLDNPLTMTLAPPGTRQWTTAAANFAPRAGFAWQPLASREDLVIRAGFGMFYDTGQGPALRGFGAFPATTNRALPNVPFPVDPSLLVGLPQNTDPPYNASFYVFPDDYRLPYTLQWNVAVEKGLGRAQSLTLSYVGSDGRRLLRTERWRNQAANAAQGLPAIVMINPALFGPTGQVFVTRNEGGSNYHALQMQFRRRLTSGLQAIVSTTWGKSLDDVSDETTANLPAGGFPGTSLNLGDNYGPSNFDQRFTMNAAVTWNLPGFGDPVTRGWGLDSYLRFWSAAPLNVITSVVDLFNIESNRRVDYLGGPVWADDANVPGGRRLNLAAFANPDAARQGNLGRNALRGFAVQQMDFALRRDFGLGERLRMQFRAELFNALNTANFGFTSARLNRNSPGLFGIADRTLNRALGQGGTAGGLNPLYQVGGPRSAQLSLRMTF